MNRYVLRGRVKRFLCRLFGHVEVANSRSTPWGGEAVWVECRRCGHLVRWEEVPTHV